MDFASTLLHAAWSHCERRPKQKPFLKVLIAISTEFLLLAKLFNWIKLF